jgi:hypothetical protein
MAADAAKRNSFRAVKNQKIARDFLIFYRSLKFYLLPIAIGTGGDSTYETASIYPFCRHRRRSCSQSTDNEWINLRTHVNNLTFEQSER